MIWDKLQPQFNQMKAGQKRKKDNSNPTWRGIFGIKCLSWFILSVLFAAELKSQEYLSSYKRVHIKKYGPENYINTLANDAKGFLWLGTNKGLFRFDGNDNEEIPLTVNNRKNVQINEMVIVGNTLFAATQDGIVQLDLDTYKTIENPTFSNIRGEIINIISNPASGVWWLTNEGQLYQWKNGLMKRMQLEIGELQKTQSLFFFKGNLWVNTVFKGTYIVDTKTMKVAQHLRFPSIKTIEWTIRKTEKDELYILSNIGLYELKEQPHGFETKKLSDDIFSKIIFQNNTRFSVIRGNRLVYHQDGNDLKHYSSIDIGAESPEEIKKIIYWNQKYFIATTNGFSVLDFKKNLFETIHSTYNKTNNTFEVPRGIIETNNEYFLSTYDAIYRYRKDKAGATPIVKKSPTSYAMLKDHDKIWIVTDGAGFRKWDIPKNTIYEQNNKNIKDFSHFKSIAQPNDSSLLLGTYHNLISFDIPSGKSKLIQIKHKDWNHNRNFIYSIQPLRGQKVQESRGKESDHSRHPARSEGNNKFYLATAWGVLLADTSGKVYADYGKNLTGTEDKQTYAIWISTDQSVWAGTGNGVYHFSETGKILHHFTTNNGLTGNRIASITPDRNNHIWVATFTGLSSINIKTFEIKNFNKEDGLPDNEFNHSSSLLTTGGEIILGTVNGFIKFKPEQLTQKTKVSPTLLISKVEVGNSTEEEKILSDAILKNDTIFVDKKHNYVRITLFMDPLDVLKKTEYAYKTKGIHAEWIKLGNTPVINLDNYKKGTYTLQVRAITGLGSMNIITKEMTVVVDEYFYKTFWFYITIVSSFFLLAFLYVLTYARRNKKIIEIRQHIAQDLHDEIGSYLTGINMNIELMQQKKGKESDQIQTIQSLGQKALMSLRDSLWSLDIKSDNGLQFWDRIKTIASEYYGPLEIPYTINEMVDMEKIHLNMLEKNYLLHVIKECITNSLKYGDRKQVEIRWELKNNLHQITISNGIGQISNTKQSGQGQYNIQTRMSRIGGKAAFIVLDNHYTVLLTLNFLT